VVLGNERAQVECIRTGDLKAREQAGAALANACANSVENQVIVSVVIDSCASTGGVGGGGGGGGGGGVVVW